MTTYREFADRWRKKSQGENSRARVDFVGQQAMLEPATENACCEVYNGGDEEIVFTNVHPRRHEMFFDGKPPTHWARIVCKPGEFAFLPHGLYDSATKSGRIMPGVINRGDSMFIGNKLPSAPETRKIRSFVK